MAVLKSEKLLSEQRPQNIVRFLEKALKAQKTLSNLDNQSLDPEIRAMNEFHESYLKVSMDYYITVHYLRERKHKEAYLLSQHTYKEIESLIDFYEKSLSADKRAAKDAKFA